MSKGSDREYLKRVGRGGHSRGAVGRRLVQQGEPREADVI